MSVSRNRASRHSRRGFTLMEVLLVLAILAVIMALVVPQYMNVQRQSSVDATKVSIKGLEQALKTYAVGHDGELPTTDNIDVLITDPGNDKKWNGPYLDDDTTLPRDAWGNPLQYEYPGPNHPNGLKADIWSWGPDKQNGTEDDINNWTVEVD